eukprot:2662454-Pyramimonas_sp.AAC.1
MSAAARPPWLHFCTVTADGAPRASTIVSCSTSASGGSSSRATWRLHWIQLSALLLPARVA